VTRRWVSRIEWARYSRPGIASSAKLTVNLMLFSGVATPAEAINKLDEGQYELVLSDSELGAKPSGRNVLAYARVKEYRPATALVTSSERDGRSFGRGRHQVSVYTENLPRLLAEVAELIGVRASRRYRPLRQAV